MKRINKTFHERAKAQNKVFDDADKISDENDDVIMDTGG